MLDLFTPENLFTLGTLAGAFLLGGTAAARAELRRVVREECAAAMRGEVRDAVREETGAALGVMLAPITERLETLDQHVSALREPQAH